MDKPLPTNPAVADAYKLYLAFGGRQHRKIEAAMREKGYKTFTRRVFYDRFELGILRPGWIKRFGWNTRRSEPTRKPLVPPRPNAIPQPSQTPVILGPRLAQPAQEDTVRQPYGPPKPHPLMLMPEHRERFLEIKALRAWLKRVSPGMNWEWRHLAHLYHKLADVTNGRTKRLMIFMPPRHGKSELVSVHYPAFRLSKDPHLNIIVGSYNQRLANRFSRKIRIKWEDSNALDAPAEDAKTRDGRQGDERKNSSFTKASSLNNAVSPVSQSPVSPSTASPSSRRTLNTVAEWETGVGGGVRAVGVGGGITGYGAKLVIIDDPIKSRSEAESETYRNRTWEWFNDDIYTRLEPDASIILIQTRWHEDDLAGRLLEEMKNGGEHWEVVSFPAIAERIENGELRMENEKRVDAVKQSIGNRTFSTILSPTGTNNIAQGEDEVRNPGESSASSPLPEGEQQVPIKNDHAIRDHSCSFVARDSSILHSPLSTDPLGRLPGDALCPERFPISDLDRIRRQLGEYSFSALYQQRPMPLEGGLFKKKWFTRIVDRAPAGLRWFRGYDLAISTKTSADFTATARCAMDRQGNIYIADVFRARLEYPDQRKLVVDRLVNERDTEHGIEQALHAQAFIQDLRREPRLARCAIRLVNVNSDKFTRALAWANRAEEGKIILVNGPWVKQFLDEVCSFPNATHDDQVDAVSLSIQMLDRRSRQFWSF